MKRLEVIGLNEIDVYRLRNSSIDQIELCVNIEKDGLTPSKNLVKKCLEVTNKDIMVMIREENTFISNKNILNKDLQMISWLASIKKDYKFLRGIVLGYVTSENKLDRKYLDKVSKVKSDLKITFHKSCENLYANKEIYYLNNYDIDAILTQGGINDITLNKESINDAIQNLDCNVMLGGGIDLSNLDYILDFNTSVHLGSLARVEKKYYNDYDYNLLNNIKDRMNNE